MLTVKPIITAGDHFRPAALNKKGCNWCHKHFNFRSNPELLNHLAGGMKGFSQCDSLPPHLIIKYQAEFDSYYGWKDNRKRDRNQVTINVEEDTLPVVKRQSILFADDEIKATHQRYAKAMYMSEASLSFGENEWVRDLFRHGVRKNYVPPTHKTLAGPMLSDEHADVARKVLKAMRYSDHDCQVWLTFDVWEGPEGTHIFTCTKSTVLAGPFVHYSIAISKLQSKDGAFLGDLMIKAIEYEHTLAVITNNILGGSTDNEAAMTTGWDIVMAKYPHLFFMPCDGHGSNLLYGDIMKLPFAAPLADSSAFLATFARNNKGVDGFLQEWSEEEVGFSHRTITVGGVRQCERHFNMGRNITFERGWRASLLSPVWEKLKRSESKDRAEAIINNPSFWRDIKALHMISRPTKVMCKLHDNSAYSTSKAYNAMMIVEEQLIGTADNRLTARDHEVPVAFFNGVKSILKDRWEFMQSDPHYASYAVDPEFWDHNIFGLAKVMGGLRRMARHWLVTPAKVTAAMAQFIDYKNKTGVFSGATVTAAARHMHPRAFWQLYGADVKALQQLALAALACNGSSMDCERVFSAYKQVWNKTTVSTTPATAHKLVFVKVNNRALLSLKSRSKLPIRQEWMNVHLDVN
jgi:hypothetical protein